LSIIDQFKDHSNTKCACNLLKRQSVLFSVPDITYNMFGLTLNFIQLNSFLF